MQIYSCKEPMVDRTSNTASEGAKHTWACSCYGRSVGVGDIGG